eukprot:superscaffoldBa00003243_g16460
MTVDGKKEPPPYIVPVEDQASGVKVYHVHTPFTPPPSSQESMTQLNFEMQVHEDDTQFFVPRKDDTRKKEQWKDKKYSAKAMSLYLSAERSTAVANGAEVSQSADFPKQPEEVEQSAEAWYIPYDMVQHNNKNRVVLNYSYQHQGNNLNTLLLPEPTLGPPLLVVLLQFHEHKVAIYT